MTKCFNFTASVNWCFQSAFTTSGLRSTITDIGDGTTVHCWVPKTPKLTRPNILLIHGFGINGLWQWRETVRILAPHFNVYVPDLVFFGDSFTTRSDRTESFQAQCLKRVMESNSVEKFSVVGMSYGGFVAYSMAVQFQDSVEKVVICSSAVCLEEKDIKEGLFPVDDVEAAAEILLPQTADKMRELMQYAFVKPPKDLPSCLLEDFNDEMCTHFVEEKKDLLRAIAKDRTLSQLPKINQPTLILWGAQDQVFPIVLAYRLKRHLGGNATLIIMENAGHAVSVEKPKEYHKHLKAFLLT